MDRHVLYTRTYKEYYAGTTVDFRSNTTLLEKNPFAEGPVKVNCNGTMLNIVMKKNDEV